MDQRPVIGVTTQTLQAIDHIPEGLPASWVMNRRYLDTLAEVGGVPLLVPLFDQEKATLRAIYDQLDALFLPGGVDLDPSSYGCDPHDLCGRTDPPRDRVELQLAAWAIADGKPVLGVCRGLQVINVVAGGTLHQDTSTLHPNAIKHDYFPIAGYARDYLAHEVTLAADSRLERIFGATVIRTNSMHHQGIERLGAGLAATAHASDGLIEGIEGVGSGFVVGVQWHPEMLIDRDDGTRRLFEEFVDAATTWRESRTVLGLSG